MKNSIPFYKMVASGNDFVVVDNRRGIVKDALARPRIKRIVMLNNME